jgi:hypothetical protein
MKHKHILELSMKTLTVFAEEISPMSQCGWYVVLQVGKTSRMGRKMM